MDFLKDVALPQSLQHVSLLHFIYAVVFMLFLPFVSLLIGSSIASLSFLTKGRKANNYHALRFAKDLIDITIVNRSVLLIFGIIPFLSLLLIYAQLLHKTEAISVGILSASFFLFAVASYLLYSYKFTFALESMFDHVKVALKNDETLTPLTGLTEVTDAIETFRKSNIKSNYRRGLWGTILLLLFSFLFIAGSTLTLEPKAWSTVETLFPLLIEPLVWLRFLHLLTISFAMTGAAALYFLFIWQGGKKHVTGDYTEYVRKIALPWTLIFLFTQPILVVIDLFLLPSESLSTLGFGAVLAALSLMFFIGHFLYSMIRESHLKFTGFVFYLMLGVFLFLIVRDTASLASATKPHMVILAHEYAKTEEELRSKMGRNIVAVSAEDIFVGKCSACHAFDRKMVGPTFNDVIPKYEGKQDELVKFILRPTKIDPAYPPMPAQGLRPSEAEAVADYIMKTFKGEK